VDIVAAGVHRPVDLGTEPLVGGRVVGSGRLLDEQPVDVDAKPDRGPLAAVEHGDGPGVSAGHAVKQFAVRSVVPGALDPRAQISVGNCHAVARIVRVRADGEFVDTYRPDLDDERRRREELATRAPDDGETVGGDW